MRGQRPTTAGIFDSTHGGWLWKCEKKPEMGTSALGNNCRCLDERPFVSNSGQTRSK